MFRTRRWLRFSLRSMLLFVLIPSVWFGYRANKAAEQRRAVAMVTELGGRVRYEFQLIAAQRAVSVPITIPPSAPGQAPAGTLIASIRTVEPLPEGRLYDLLGIDWFHKVQRVSLSGKKITDRQLGELLDNLPDIVDLQLGETLITDAGIERVSSLQRLEKLDLRGTAITDDCLRRLNGCHNLEVLLLDETSITDRGLAHLSGMKTLRMLSLRDTNVTWVSINELLNNHGPMELVGPNGGRVQSQGPANR